ncbi:gag-pol polyprotein, partial [Tanacetum coccineum]
VQFLQQFQPEWPRFVTVVKQNSDFDKESYYKLFDILKQYQNEVNEVHAEKLARNANPLALVAATQHYPDDTYYQAPKPQKPIHHPQDTQHQPVLMQLLETKEKRLLNQLHLHLSQHLKKTMIQNKLREIRICRKTWHSLQNTSKISTNLPTTTSELYQTPGTRKETIGNQVVQKTGIQCFNCKEYGHFAKECRKPKREKDYEYHKEKMILCKQESKGVPLSAEQDEWLHDTAEESAEQKLEAHYMYMAKIQERQHSEQPQSINDTYVVESVDSNVIPNSSDMCDNEEEDDQYADDHEDERVALANLIANFKIDIDENKMTQNQLRKANATLTHELNECKYDLEE